LCQQLAEIGFIIHADFSTDEITFHSMEDYMKGKQRISFAYVSLMCPNKAICMFLLVLLPSERGAEERKQSVLNK